jgi:hypothetical protein
VCALHVRSARRAVRNAACRARRRGRRKVLTKGSQTSLMARQILCDCSDEDIEESSPDEGTTQDLLALQLLLVQCYRKGF